MYVSLKQGFDLGQFYEKKKNNLDILVYWSSVYIGSNTVNWISAYI